jgi:tellurite resistance protein
MAAAYSGNRRLEVTCTAVPTYVSKQALNSRTLWAQAICSAQASLVVDLETPGYLEREEKSRDAKALIVEVALACAQADGSIDERELKAVSRWMRATLSQMDEDDKDEIAKTRAALNAAFKKGSGGQVDLAAACRALKACKLAPMNQQALALCVEVIAADGELHDNELASVRKIAAALGIDYARLQALMDKQFIQAGITVAADNLEALVGVDPSWDKEKIRKHLSEQFQKWNARAPNAKTTEDQARIRSILDAIAKLRKKYS